METEAYTLTFDTLQTIVSLLNVVLLTVGLWKLFPKCGVKKQTALIPFFRLYKLAQAADKEDAGIILAFSKLALDLVPLVFEVVEAYITTRAIALITLAVILVLSFTVIIYEFRVYLAICRLFHKKGVWVILWCLLSAVPALIWGFDPKVLPAYDTSSFDDSKAAPLSGTEAQATGEGLTVNLESRTTWEMFRKQILLQDIHLNIKPGKMVLLLGGSGAGKTTLVNAIIGYETAKAKILLNGEDVYKHYDKMKYEIALVPQGDLMRLDDTVLRTLTDAAILRMPEEVSKKERSRRVAEVLNIFGLTEVRQSEVEKLSGGQRKRLSIAMEFISDPYLFVLDEPDSGLDGVLARDLMRRLREISRQGKIVIVITHSPDRVEDLFDDVIVLAKDANKTGRLVYYGPIEDSRKFFGVEKMEEVVKQINRKDEGGEGRADELIQKFMEVSHAEQI